MPSRFVYLAQSSDGPCKIGWSRNPAERVQTLSAEAHAEVVLLHQIETPFATWLEGYLHRRFFKQRLEGEWFNLGADDVASIQAMTTETAAALRSSAPPSKLILIDPDVHRMITIICFTKHIRIEDYVADKLREALSA